MYRVDGKTQRGITQKVLFGLTGITQKGKTQKGKTQKDFQEDPETHFARPNQNHSERKDSE
jgi:hypothetical protein